MMVYLSVYRKQKSKIDQFDDYMNADMLKVVLIWKRFYKNVRQLLLLLFSSHYLVCCMQQDPLEEDDPVLEFTAMTLFDQDPLEPDLSFFVAEQEISPHALHLLSGEQLLSETHFPVQLDGDPRSIRGPYELIITNYRLALYRLHVTVISEENTPLSFPYGYMQEIELQKREIMLKLKTGLVFRIKPFSDLQNIYQTILFGCTHLPFYVRRQLDQEESLSYDCLAELQRMRINWQAYIIVKNPEGKLCSTYPKYFVVGKNIEQNLLQECLRIRNGSRIPILTYYSYRYKSGLWRAARPKLNQEQNKYNKTYLKLLSKDLYIIDMREDELTHRQKDNLKDIDLTMKFQPLAAVNNTFKKIVVSYTRESSVLKVIGKWYEDIASLITCAYLAVQQMNAKKEVLLQENWGLDRVCQVSALVQIIIDPFFRTIHGLSLLVQKQFVSFGHPFSRRLGFERQRISESCPIFIQFLQCVNQLIVTHPNCFEYSCFFIGRLAYQTYTTKYNNFYYNTAQQKANSKYIVKTPSIWKQLSLRKQFYNYQWEQKEASQELSALRRPPSVKEFSIWREFYDLISEMKAQMPEQTNVKQRRSSLYKILHKKPSREF